MVSGIGAGLSQETGLSFTEAEQAWLANKHLVRVYHGEFPPYHFSEGAPVGISVDYLNLIAYQAGFDIEYLNDLSWVEALAGLSDCHDIDIIPTIKNTPHRRQNLTFTRDYIRSPWVIYTQRNRPYIGSFKELESKWVAVEDDFAVREYLETNYPDIRLQVVKTSAEAMGALADGKVEAYVGNLIIGTYLMNTHNWDHLTVAAITPLEDLSLAMAVRNDWPELAGIIDKTLASLTEAEHAAVRNVWLSPPPAPESFQFQETIKWGIIFLVAFVVFSAFVLRVRQEMRARKRVETDHRDLIRRLKKSLAETQELESLLTRCVHCNDIRTDEDNWLPVDQYLKQVTSSTDLQTTCPRCLDTHQPASKKANFGEA